MRLGCCIAIPLLLVAASLHAAPQEAPAELLAGMDVQVAADGSVASVMPDTGLPSALSGALVHRVAQWHFKPATWHGKPVSTTTSLVLRLQPTPTTAGGFAMRILGTGWLERPGYEFGPPIYPVSARKAGVTGVFVYQILVATDGSMAPVKRLIPEGKLHGHASNLDAAALDAIAKFRRPPVMAEGQVIECSVVYPFRFSLTHIPATSVPGLKEAADAMPDRCPNAVLETKIEDELL